jgi:hypothetical protein
VFLDTKDSTVKLSLAALATASFVLAILIQVEASKDAAFTKRTLSRLIQASTPSTLFGQAVTQIAIREASKRDYPNAQVARRTRDDGYAIQIVFADAAEQTAQGYFQFDHERLAQWSLLDESRLAGEISREMFERGPMSTANPLDDWNELVEFIGSTSSGLYPDSIRDGAFGISANTESVEIGVPYPASVSPSETARTRLLQLGGRPVPFLVFSRIELDQLIAQSNLVASRTVAAWLETAWGTPTAFAGHA